MHTVQFVGNSYGCRVEEFLVVAAYERSADGLQTAPKVSKDARTAGDRGSGPGTVRFRELTFSQFPYTLHTVP